MVALATRPLVVLSFRFDSGIGSLGVEVREVERYTLYDHGRAGVVNVLEFGLPDSPAWQVLSRRERSIQLAPMFRKIAELQEKHDLRIMFRTVREDSLLTAMETASAMMDHGVGREDIRFILYPVLYGFKAESGKQIVENFAQQYGFLNDQFVCFDVTESQGSSQTRRF